jgi:ABC-type sugar transport system substrate-binding protein
MSSAYRKFPTFKKLMLAASMLGTVSPALADDVKVGFSTIGLSNTYNVVLAELIKEGGEKNGYHMLPPVDSQFNSVKQANDTLTVMGAGLNGLLIQIVDGKAIKGVLDRAEAAKIPVVAVDVGPSEGAGKVAMTVTASASVLATQACESLAKLMDGKGKVLEIQGAFINQMSIDRSTGFTECMKQSYPNIQVISKQGEWKADRATSIVQTVMGTDPDIGGIYLASDAAYLSSTLSALKRLDMYHKAGEEGHIKIVSIDGSPFAHQQIRDGYLDIAVGQPMLGYVQWGLFYLKGAMEGKTFKAGPTDHGSEIVQQADGNLSDVLPPAIITKANVEDPQLWGNHSAVK